MKSGNSVEDITENVITGKDFAEQRDAATRSMKHNQSELEQIRQREGKTFEYEKELEEAKRQYTEYSEAMKHEMEEKEKKYAEMDKDVEEAEDVEYDGEDDGEDGGVRAQLGEERDGVEQREAVLRDAVVDRLRSAGLDVSMDSEWGQRVLDEANGEARMSAKKRRALETASVPRGEKHQPTVVSSADGAKVLNELDTAIENYENRANRPKTFLGDTAKALGATQDGSTSEYATFETKNGKIVTIRLANHNATVSNFDHRGESEGISIVVSSKGNAGITNDGSAHVVEYYYDAIRLRRADGKPLADILRSIKQALYSGEFTDTTGLAERQEVNADDVVRYNKAYHGSGADFDHFDHSHMGEGEGAQAYGWGTYVTEVEGIGRTYAEQNSTKQNPSHAKLTRLRFYYDMSKEEVEELQREVEESENDVAHNRKQMELCREKGDTVNAEYFAKELRASESVLKSDREQLEVAEHKMARIKAEIDKMEGLNDVKPVCHLYTVEIPDDTGENYLDWNEPLTDGQKEVLRKHIPALCEKNYYDDITSYLLGKNGERIYKTLKSVCGSYETASKALSEMGFVGIKYPADYHNGGNKDGKQNYVIFDEKDARITDHVCFFRTDNGEAYGFTVGGKIYIDPRVADAETPVHEYAHLWATALKNGNPKEWRNVVGLMKGTTVWDEVRKRYPELETDDEVADEVLATYSGRRGAERLRAEMRKAAEGDGSVMDKAEAVSALERVREALKHFWKGVADMLHIHYTSAEEVADRVMKDLLDGVDPRELRDYDADEDMYREGDTKRLRNGASITFRRKPTTTYKAVKRWLADNGIEYSDHTARTGSMYMSFWTDDVEYNIRNSDHTAPEYGGASEYGRGESVYVYDNKVDTVDIDLCNSELRAADVRRLVAEVAEVNKESDAVRTALLRDRAVPRDVERRYPVLCSVLDVENDEEKRLKEAYADYVKGVREEMLSGFYPFTSRYGVVIEEDGTMSHPTWQTIWKNSRRDAEMEMYEAKAKIGEEAEERAMSFDDWVKAREDEELEKANERFNERLDSLMKDPSQKGRELQLGRPGQFLKDAGLADSEIVLDYDRLVRKASEKYRNSHPFSMDDIKDLPKAINSPIAVFDNTNGESRGKVILTELAKDGKNFIVAVRASERHQKGGVVLEVNEIRTLFPKESRGIVNWLNTGKASNMNKEKALAWLGALRTHRGTELTEQELSSAAKIVENFENPKRSDENILRDGEGAYTDEELSWENDPVGKMLGRSRWSKREQGEFAARERERMAGRVDELAERMHLDNVEVVTDASTLEGRRKRAKGFYNKRSGKITIVIPNHASMADVEQTLLHEAVAHYGLRELFGEHFDTFLREVYEHADGDVRAGINALMARNGWDVDKATEEYLAGLAEDTDFEGPTMGRGFYGWWSFVKRAFRDMLHKLGFGEYDGPELSDNELRYILWRSYENLKEPGRYRSVLDEAGDISKQMELKVGEFAETKAMAMDKAGEGMASEPKPVGRSFFGNVYDQFKGKVAQAVKFLARHESGDLLGVFHRNDIGDIDMVWGDNGGGLCHILNKHISDKDFPTVKDLVSRIEDIVNNGAVDFSNGDRVVLKKDGYVVTIRRNFRDHGKKIADKNWVLTAYNKEAPATTMAPAGGMKGSTAVAPDATSGAKLAIMSEINEMSDEKVPDEDDMFRDGDDVDYEKAQARARYEERVSRGMYQMQEAMQDSMLGLKEAMDAVLRAEGKKQYIEDVAGYENAYLGENRLSSVNQAECEAFQRTLMKTKCLIRI